MKVNIIWSHLKKDLVDWMKDLQYCASSYLMYRYIFQQGKCFRDDIPVNIFSLNFKRTPVKTADDLIETLDLVIKDSVSKGETALALSGGIDSAILARLMPKGIKAYTFRCVVPGKRVIDETKQAAVWAESNGLNHKIIDITWENIVSVADKLMLHKGAPIHSIETQIYIASCKAKEDGVERFVFGENADIIYGGMDGLLQRDWHFGEFVDRYMYVNPYYVLKEPRLILEPFKNFEKDGYIDGHDFINMYFRQEALGSYNNACQTAGMEFVGPYSLTYFSMPIDYKRIRAGDTKYIIREAFKKLYPEIPMPKKIPMPRPMNEWFENWKGPHRKEFIPHCADNMSGDQKWMIWSLERFLDLIGE